MASPGFLAPFSFAFFALFCGYSCLRAWSSSHHIREAAQVKPGIRSESALRKMHDM
jgi:hypothetical protein